MTADPWVLQVPAVHLELAGTALSRVVMEQLHTLEVDLRDDGPSAFTLTFLQAASPLSDTLEDLPITEGMPVVVRLGWGTVTSRTTPVLTGLVTAVTLTLEPDGASLWRIEGFDRLHELSYGTTSHVYGGSGAGARTDKEIVLEVGLRHDVKPIVGDAGPPPPLPRVQNGESDLRFLQRLAALTGNVLWADPLGTLHFQPERAGTSPPKRVTRGEDIISFAGRRTLSGQVGGVTAHGWDPTTKEPVSASATPGSTRSIAPAASSLTSRATLDVRSPTITSEAAARSLADAVAADVAADLVTVSIAVNGDPALAIASRLVVRGVGRFDGEYQVTSARHVVSDQGYLTYLECIPATTDRVPGSRALGRSHPPATVVPVIVTDVEDPENLGRVKVRVADVPDDFWVRLLAPGAGKQRGIFWLPAIGDEAVLVAEGPDLTAGYVVGFLWNGVDPPPEPASATATRRTLRTPKGSLLRFDDTDGAERIEVVASDGRTTVVLDGAGGVLTLRAAKDLTVEAPDGTLKLTGSTVEVASTTGTKVSSDASSELTAVNGITIRGARVDIN